MSRDRKFRCNECESLCYDSELLRAPNPFDPKDTLIGCPHCQQPNAFTLVCDQPFCTKDASCGTPTADGGYRQTCYEHRPKESA